MDNSAPIDVGPAVQQDTPVELIDISQANAPKTLPEDEAAQRAKKFYGGLAKILNRSEDSIKYEISTGNEQSLRNEAASILNNNESIRRQQVVIDIAKQQNRKLTPDEYRNIMINPTPFDPETAPEKEYAKYYTQVLDRPDTFMSDVFTEQQRKDVGDARSIGNDFISKREILQKETEDQGTVVGNQSWPGYIVDQAKGVIPFYNEAMQRGLVPGVGAVAGGLLLGDNIAEQSKELFRKPMPEFLATIKAIKENFKDNPSLGHSYLSALLGQSSSEQGINNIFTLWEPSSLPGGAAIKSLGSFKSAAIGAVKDVAKASAIKQTDKALAEAYAGNVAEAAVEKTGNRIVDSLRVKKSAMIIADEELNAAPQALRVDMSDIKANPGRWTENIVQRLMGQYENGINNLVKTITDKINIERTPALTATKEEINKFREGVKALYPNIENSILDVSPPLYNHTTGTFTAELYLGKQTGELWNNPMAAKHWATQTANLPESLFNVERLGTGYYISLRHQVSETDGFVRDMLIGTKIAKEPDSMFGAWLGWLRNPDETLSLHQRMERKVAVYGASNLMKLAKEDAKYISQLKTWRDLGRKTWKDFERVINQGKNTVDPDTQKLGWWAKSPVDLDNLYLRTLNRLPSQAETEAYFAYKRITEYDRVYREILVQRNMRRAGAEQHQFSVLGEDGKTKITTGYFNGVRMNEMPSTQDTILVLGKSIGEHKFYDADSMRVQFKKIHDQLKDDIRTGRKVVVRIWDPESRPLGQFPGVGNARVRYVVADAVDDSKPIAWGQIPRRGGGHFEYDYETYIKQAKIRVDRLGDRVYHWYEGDTTIMPMAIRKMGSDVAKHLDDVRIKLKARDVKGAKAVFDQFAPAGLEWKEVRGWFVRKRVDGVMQEPYLSLNEPIRAIGKNEKLVDVDNSIQNRYPKTFRNGTTTGSDARQLQVQFTGERDSRDIWTINNEGSRSNPLYKYEPAKFVDPMTTMERSFTKIANSSFMDDYKITSVEHWLEQAKPYLKATESELRNAPFHWFHVGPAEFKNDAKPEVVQRLKTTHWQIDQFLGKKSDIDNLLHSSAQKLADSMYEKWGSVPIDPLWALPKLRDPTRFIRSIAFHTKLGMFAVPQLLVQGQTYSVIAGIAGLGNATKSVGAAFMSRIAIHNQTPEVLSSLDRMMSKMGWKVGEWTESNHALQRTGFMNVAGEYAIRDDMQATKVIQGAWGKFLDAGAIFFTEGERFSRMGAWHAAYREFRDANPIGKLTDANIKQILERADTLSVNMSRASSSMLHTGVLSLPSQFLAYQIRMAELMWGKRLTFNEKARILGVQAALYGVPTAVGVSGLPVADFFRKAALENGYNVGQNWAESLIGEGLPALMIALLTGGGDISKGQWYNVGDRFGTQGFETIREALRGDRTFWEIIGGAGFSVAKGIWDGSDGFREAMLSGLRDDGKKVPMTVDDVVDVAKEVSSVNALWKGLVAINTGRWFSKKENYLTDVSKTQAVVMALTGLQPQAVSDLQLMAWSGKDKAALEKYVGEQFTQELRRAIRVQNDSPQQAQKYITRAFAFLNVGGFPEEKRAQLIAKASQDYQSLIESMNWRFYVTNTPDAQRERRMNTFITKAKQAEEKRNSQ